MAHLLRVVLYGKQCLQTDIVGFLLLQMYAFILIVWQRQEVRRVQSGATQFFDL